MTSLLIVNNTKSRDPLLGREFADAGFQVSETRLESEILEIVEERHPQVVLLDSDSIGIEVIEFCRELKAAPALRSIPIFVHARIRCDEAIVRVLEAGATDSVIHPVNTKVLETKLRAAARAKEDHDTLCCRNRLLAEMALSDELTGLKNLSAFRQTLAAESSLAQLRGLPLSLVVLDLDDFVTYNERFGQAAGDAVLRKLGSTLGQATQRDCLAARNGGKQFMVLLPNYDAEAACLFAEQLRRSISEQQWPHSAITVSLGVATAIGGGLELISQADRSLARSKELGSNQVTHHREFEFASSALAGSTLQKAPKAELRLPEASFIESKSSPLVLHVDVDERNRENVRRILAEAGFRSQTASTGAEALGRASTERADLIILDIVLPDINGFEVCRRLKTDPTTAKIPILHLSDRLIPGHGHPLCADLGADAYLAQPIEPDELILTARALIRIRRTEEALRKSCDELEKAVRSRTELIERSYDATIEGLARALELRDHDTEGHSRRVTEMTLRLAKVLGIPEADLTHLRRGAMLHDIGKIGIPDRILHKAGPLDEEERAVMQKHPTYAVELLRTIDFLRPALEIPFCHHERWDGTGYPQGLKGTEIPLSARIFAVVDVWDALRHDRSYRRAWPESQVREHILNLAGSHLDPHIVPIFLETCQPNANTERSPLIT